MVKQIAINENNVVQLCSIGGIIEGGINVAEIPDEVKACPSKWVYEDGRFRKNEAYTELSFAEENDTELTLDDVALAVAELAENTASGKLEVEMAIAELAEVILNG